MMIEPYEESTEIFYIEDSIVINVRTYRKQWWGNGEISYFLQIFNYVPVLYFKFHDSQNDFFVHFNFTNAADSNFDLLKEELEIVLLNTPMIGQEEGLERRIRLSTEDTEKIEICFANQTGHSYSFIEGCVDFIYSQEKTARRA